MGFLLILLGGIFNFLNFHRIYSTRSNEDSPFKSQSYMVAFVMGCIFYGLPMYGLYWLIK